MKRVVIILMLFTCLLLKNHLVNADLLSNLENTKQHVNKTINNITETISPRLEIDDIKTLEVKRLNKILRVFKLTDGYEEKVMRKVLEWINTGSIIGGSTDQNLDIVPIKLELKNNNGIVATIEPAYDCSTKGETKVCTVADGEVVFESNNKRVRLKSQELYDWLLVGWKLESNGPSEQELLEETLYFRYYSYLDKKYYDFIMCPQIDSIKRINGDTRSHIVSASALNYGGHHNGPYDKINIILTDTPEEGVKIKKIKVLNNISEKESIEQCN
jgi:hypothetical protein